jgi:hypothetical protein
MWWPVNIYPFKYIVLLGNSSTALVTGSLLMKKRCFTAP